MVKKSLQHTRSPAAGFSLIELMIVSTIIALLATFMVVNFRSNRLNFNKVTAGIIADIRVAQVKAISSAEFKGVIPCGYGIKIGDASGDDEALYSIFVGIPDRNDRCQGNPKYDRNKDEILFSRDVLTTAGLIFDKRFKDIFFEPPDPKVYIDGNDGIDESEAIVLRPLEGERCNQSGACKSICVYGSGRIEVVDGDRCDE